MLKTLFWHQYLQDLGLENFFSHHYLYQKTFQIIIFLFSKFGGHPYTVPLIGPIEKSLHEFFFFNFFGARIFFFCFLCSIFIFAFSPAPPITFLMVRPLINLDFHLQEKFRKLCFCEDSCAVMRSSRNDLLAWSQFNFFIPIKMLGVLL